MGILRPIKALTDFLSENQKSNMIVAEIGVYDGSTTSDYIEIIKKNQGKLLVIDWFQGNENVGGTHGFNPSNKDSVINMFKDNLKNYLDIITIMDGTSHEMITKIEDNSLDFCFIDADHRYSFVYKDIELLIPKMKQGGIMIGHDFEDIGKNMIPFIRNEWLEIDYSFVPELQISAHCGVIKAVHDHFGYDIEVRPDPYGQRAPIWIKRF
jgi:hypothetical protein